MNWVLEPPNCTPVLLSPSTSTSRLPLNWRSELTVTFVLSITAGGQESPYSSVSRIPSLSSSRSQTSMTESPSLSSASQSSSASSTSPSPSSSMSLQQSSTGQASLMSGFWESPRGCPLPAAMGIPVEASTAPMMLRSSGPAVPVKSFPSLPPARPEA